MTGLAQAKPVNSRLTTWKAQTGNRMIKDAPIEEGNYGLLLGEITTLCEKSEISTVSIYWQIGKCITEAAGEISRENSYGTHLINRLSRDLGERFGKGYSPTNLKNMRTFYLQWDHDRITPRIDWSNYVTLLTVKDPQMRRALEEKIISLSLTNYQLKKTIQAERIASLGAGGTGFCAPQLACSRGSLYTYRIAPEVEGRPAAAGEADIDCGFSIRRSIPVRQDRALTVSALVRTAKSRNGYSVQETPQGSEELYFYRAYVQEIIDGDTIRAVIDCGFRTTVSLKLRLRGIDAAELGTAEGDAAASFAADRLKDSPVVGLKTWKNDKYGRYLADLFYIPGEESAQRIIDEGIFLNQELLNTGHAIKA